MTSSLTLPEKPESGWLVCFFFILECSIRPVSTQWNRTLEKNLPRKEFPFQLVKPWLEEGIILLEKSWKICLDLSRRVIRQVLSYVDHDIPNKSYCNASIILCKRVICSFCVRFKTQILCFYFQCAVRIIMWILVPLLPSLYFAFFFFKYY